jgi:periplasmic divalent cation tolerance protein
MSPSSNAAPPGAIVVLITCPDAPTAETIARALVEEGLAACVNLIPGVTSIYRWEGKLCRESEILLAVKTRRRKLAALERRVRALHPYTVPEIVALPIVAGSPAYLEWIRAMTP